MRGFIALISGIIFSLGLGISGMTKPQVVRGFLDFFGEWNPSLLGVMGGAILVHTLTYRMILKRHAPILDSSFHLPTNKNIDPRLIIGSAIFGLGWGWAGICPGPGIVALLSGNLDFVIFVAAMLAGMLAFQAVEKRLRTH